MTQKSWAVGEEVLAADFNTYVQTQVVPQFTGTTQRDAQWAAPPNGALCVTTDTNTLWQRIAGVWVGSKTAGGVLGNIERTTATAAITAETTLALDLTFTVAANRRIELTASWPGGTNGTSGNQFWLTMKEGAAIITQARSAVGPGNFGPPLIARRVITPTAGSHTYGIYGAGSVATVFVADANQVASFTAVDLGAV